MADALSRAHLRLPILSTRWPPAPRFGLARTESLWNAGVRLASLPLGTARSSDDMHRDTDTRIFLAHLAD